MISKKDGRYVLRSRKTGKVLGTHPSKKKAMAQERAIQAAKHSRGK